MTPIKTFNLDLDLDLLKRDCRRINNKVVKEYGELDAPKTKVYQEVLAGQLEDAPMTSKLHDYYNVFSFPYDGISELYKKVIDTFKPICQYDDQYYVHAWLNYQQKGEAIPWHYHWGKLSGLNKTYVATIYINAEPSVTTYKFPEDKIYINNNVNNTMTIYEDMGDIHMVDAWTEDAPRISISMDFVPMKYIQGSQFLLNTWIPVL